MTGQVHWWLVGLAFVLGMVLTFALMVSPAKSEAPDDISADRPSVDAERPVMKTATAATPTKKIPARKAPPTKKVPAAKKVAKVKPRVAKEAVTRPVPLPQELPTQRLSVAKEATEEFPAQQIPAVPFAPYGPGSARADADGGGPEGWPIKGRTDTRHYYTPDDACYDGTVAQVWFQDEVSAARAFFTPWRSSVTKK